MRVVRWIGGITAILVVLGGAAPAAANPVPEAWARAHGAARDAWKRGDLVAAGRALKLGYKLARQAGHREAARRSLQGLAKVYQRLDRPEQAQRALALAEGLDLTPPAPDPGLRDELAEAAPAPIAPPMTVDDALAQLARGGPEVPQALEALEVAAHSQDVRALRVLGALHIEGKLVEPDMEVGMDWIDQAIDLGDASSMVYKAELLERGLGLALDLAAARDLYRQAAEAGDMVAAHRLGNALFRRGRVQEAERWLRAAAEKGRISAQVDLGVLLYRAGTRDEEAADWFHRAAQAGEAAGRYNLGLCLLQGRGLLTDQKLGMEYLHEAAEAGHPAARQALQVLGEEVPPASAEVATD